MLLREIKDVGATIAWSPTAREPSMLAIGTKEGAGTSFDNYGGELQVKWCASALCDQAWVDCHALVASSFFPPALAAGIGGALGGLVVCALQGSQVNDSVVWLPRLGWSCTAAGRRCDDRHRLRSPFFHWSRPPMTWFLFKMSPSVAARAVHCSCGATP